MACVLAATARGDDNGNPRVSLAWPSGPLETRLALDRPVDDAFAARLLAAPIRFATDRRNVEEWRRLGSPTLKPPLGTMKVAGARVADAGRTLILATDPHPRDAVYTLETPLLGPGATPTAGDGPGMRVAYDLSGASASWSEDREGATPDWQGWWPDLDADASRRLTRGSVEHQRAFARLAERGHLAVESLITLPAGRVTLTIVSSGPLEASLDGENAAGSGKDRAEFGIDSTGEPSDLLLTVRTGTEARPFTLKVTYRKEGDAAETPLARGRQLVPWSPAPAVEPAAMTPPGFELAEGDRRRGEAVFFGEQAKCSACHKAGGKGGVVGPELGDLSGRKLIDVYRDVAEPSARIHPDYVGYTLSLKDGRVLVGVVRALGLDAVQVTDPDAKVTRVARSEIDELRPSATSIMPVGLAGAIGEGSVRDLLAFLTSPAAGHVPSGKP